MVDVNRETEFDLDSTLDDIEDLPTFGAWPTGAYIVTLSQSEKTPNEKMGKCIEVKFTHISTAELGDKKIEDIEPKPGDESTQLVSLKNNAALNPWKKNVMAPLEEKFGKGPARKTIAASNGCQCLVVLAKTDKGYQQIKMLKVL